MSYPENWKCPSCHKIVKDSKKCAHCGFEYSLHYPNLWSCPECGKLVHKSRSCPKCNYPNELHYPHLWHCPECGKLVHKSRSCSKCGYNKKKKMKFLGYNVKKLEDKITGLNKLLREKKKIVIGLLGFVCLISIILILSVPVVPKNELIIEEELVAGEEFSILFLSGTEAQNVVFDFTGPDGENFVVDGFEEEQGRWVGRNVSLNKSGKWSVTTKMLSYGNIIEKNELLNVPSACMVHEDCGDERLCCNGACIEVCESSIDCSDNKEYTVDECIHPGTCNAYCSHSEVGCVYFDGYCPSDCDRTNDNDCTNCPENQILCNGYCSTPCYSNNDCEDGDPTTADICHTNNDPCDSYCESIPYKEAGCPEGKVYDYISETCINPACTDNSDCDDGRKSYAHRCINPGTVNARCIHEYCSPNEIICNNYCTTPECDSNRDCRGSDENAYYYCVYPGTCDAECVKSCETGYEKIDGECMRPCRSDNDCYMNKYCCDGYCFEPECSYDTDCVSDNPCIFGVCEGTGCDKNCVYEEITVIGLDDGCCPEEGNFENDPDCTGCGSGQIICEQSCFTPECMTPGDCSMGFCDISVSCKNGGTCDADCEYTSYSPIECVHYSNDMDSLDEFTKSDCGRLIAEDGFVEYDGSSCSIINGFEIPHAACLPINYSMSANIQVINGGAKMILSSNTIARSPFWHEYVISGEADCMNSPGFYNGSSESTFLVDDVNIWFRNCGDDEVLYKNKCVKKCDSDNDCSSGKYCSEYNTCMIPWCFSDGQCESENNGCYKNIGCTTFSNPLKNYCSGELITNPSWGESDGCCPAGSDVSKDIDCECRNSLECINSFGSGYLCEEGKCEHHHSCSDSLECMAWFGKDGVPENDICVSGACGYKSCDSGSDCPVTQACINSYCTPICYNKYDCYHHDLITPCAFYSCSSDSDCEEMFGEGVSCNNEKCYENSVKLGVCSVSEVTCDSSPNNEERDSCCPLNGDADNDIDCKDYNIS